MEFYVNTVQQNMSYLLIYEITLESKQVLILLYSVDSF